MEAGPHLGSSVRLGRFMGGSIPGSEKKAFGAGREESRRPAQQMIARQRFFSRTSALESGCETLGPRPGVVANNVKLAILANGKLY